MTHFKTKSKHYKAINRIIELYETKMTPLEIGKKLDISQWVVRRLLVASGHPMRNRSQAGQKYEIDNHLFSSIDSPWKAYFLEWIWSDGCLSNNEIIIELIISDKQVLNYFNDKIFDGKKPIALNKPKTKKFPNGKIYTSKESARFMISNKQISEDLRELGLHEHKSHTIEYPRFNGFERDFIRGYFEGNGCIVFGNKNKVKGKYKSINIFGSESLAKSIQHILLTNNIKSCIYFRKTSNIFSLCIGSLSEILKFYEFIYSDNPEFVLERKRQVFANILAWYNETKQLINL